LNRRRLVSILETNSTLKSSPTDKADTSPKLSLGNLAFLLTTPISTP
jgi:hypothetical protein